MKIFLSHSSQDKKFVKKLGQALESQGYKTWCDENDILVGDSITEEIDKGLKDSDVVLVFLSKYSVKSRWVSTEWQYKFFDQVNRGEVYILPLLIEQCEVPTLLRDKKYADFSDLGLYETSLSNLIRSLRKIDIRNNKGVSLHDDINESIFEYTKELLDELEEECIVLPTLGEIPIVDTLKKIKRSGKLVRLESFRKPKLKIRTIYDHTLSVAHLADCLLPLVNHTVAADKQAQLARVIAFHEFNETILGDIPSYTNLKEKNRDTSANPAEQTLRSVPPGRREQIANDFIWMFLSEKQRLSLESVLECLSQKESNLTSFFKMVDKIDPIITVWRYLNHYRGQIDDIKSFLRRMRDFFEYPVVVNFSTSTEFGHQLPNLLKTLLNKNLAMRYYCDPDIFQKQTSLYDFDPSIIKTIIEGCPLFVEG